MKPENEVIIDQDMVKEDADKTTKDGVKNFFQGGDWATFFQEMPASIADTNFKAGVETP